MRIESNNNLFSKGQEVSLLIEKLLYGGSGLAHIGSMACFIDDVIPGETVRAKITGVKRQYATASLSAVVEASAQRVTPPCDVFGTCGGCQWQHLDYCGQLHWKRLIVRECLERIGGIHDTPVLEPLPSPAMLQYRSRTNLKVSSSRAPAIGYFQRGTHHVIPVTFCPLLAAPLNQALAFCSSLCEKNSTLVRNIDEIQLLRAGSSNEVLITFCNETLIKSCLLFTPGPAQHAVIHPEPSLPSAGLTFHDDIMGISFSRSPLTFYQVNRDQNAAMITAALNYLAPFAAQNILDLYCGCGNFSLFLAREGASVVGIDASSNAITEAITNAAANGLHTCVYACGDVEKTIRQFSSVRFHGVLINPPRRGCSPGILNHIRRINPHSIVYVSCNPATLARDLKLLMAGGYHIEAIQPVDMFPQTYHIETIVKMIKS
jgi:23S rRNA (uracil1939-C5)-methyltransferase